MFSSPSRTLRSFGIFGLIYADSGFSPTPPRTSVRKDEEKFAWCMNSPEMVEMRRIELLTPCLQGRCSPSWATPPSGVSLRFSPLQYFVKALRHTLSIVFIALPCLVKADVTYCFGLSSALWLLNRCVNFTAVWIFFATAAYLWYAKERKNSKCTKFGGPKWTRTTDLTLIRRAL